MKRSMKSLIGSAIYAGLFLGIIAGIGPASNPAVAGSGAAFLGGMLTSHVVGGFVRRDRAKTQAAQYQAYSQPQQAQPAAPQGGGGGSATSVEAKLNKLDTLAAKGYISKDEYHRRRQAILDAL